MKVFKYRLYPTKEQQAMLWRHSLALNRLHNSFITLENFQFATRGKHLNQFYLNTLIPNIKETDNVLPEIYAQVLQQVSYRVATSYQAFFKHAIQHPPSFRSCRKFYNICYPQNGYKLSDNTLETKIYGSIRCNFHRKIEGNIKQIYITSSNNTWFLCVVTDIKSQIKPKELRQPCGIDMGTTNLVVTSDNECIKNTTDQKYFDKQIDKLKSKRDLSFKKGSRNFKYLSSVISKLHGVKARKTRDFLHKVSHHLASNYDVVYIEDLNVKKLGSGEIASLNKSMHNASIGMLVTMMKYKMLNVVEVNPVDTSKTCSKCGHTIRHLPLSERTFVCPNCQLTLDRDYNAALNILYLGRAMDARMASRDSSIHDIIPHHWIEYNPLVARN